jgi:hypothetical protein
MAAASNKRLKVMPPDVTATTEPGLLDTVEETAGLEKNDDGVTKISAGALAEGFPRSWLGEGEKLVNASAPAVSRKPSEGSWEASCGSVMNLDFIA